MSLAELHQNAELVAAEAKEGQDWKNFVQAPHPQARIAELRRELRRDRVPVLLHAEEVPRG
jgi:hypothetical protein